VRRVVDAPRTIERGEEAEDSAVARNPHGLPDHRLVIVGQAGVPVPHPDEHLVRLTASGSQRLFTDCRVEYDPLDNGHELFLRHEMPTMQLMHRAGPIAK
jgi:hypothetical protein